MGIAELEKEITAILNRLIADPALAEPAGPEPAAAPSLEIGRMENEIERQLEALDFDKARLQAEILQCAARKYSEHTGVQHITDKAESGLGAIPSAFGFFYGAFRAHRIRRDNRPRQNHDTDAEK